MALCPVAPMNDVPMISATHKDCALPLAVRGCHPSISHPNSRATGQRSIRLGAANLGIAWRYSDGRMAACPVDPMNDDPMISALPFVVRGCHPIISHPNNRIMSELCLRVLLLAQAITYITSKKPCIPESIVPSHPFTNLGISNCQLNIYIFYKIPNGQQFFLCVF